MKLMILYRGPLSSCNYDCHYCPFAKRHETAAELKRDELALVRLADWIANQREIEFSVLFTPWGEALVRRSYQSTLSRLSKMDHLRKVSIQTNLSCNLDWLANCDLSRLALWCTFHPSQVSRGDFLSQCRRMDEMGVSYSVGSVGLRDSFPEISLLREELSPLIYLWINAYQDEPDYYSPEDIRAIEKIDPLFRLNTVPHVSLGRHCLAGETVISVDGSGDIRRCHFLPEIIGNIYESDLPSILLPRVCTKETCNCHIGYIHLPHLGQYAMYGEGLLERIPRERIWREKNRSQEVWPKANL
jgi:MoaA/NifB/PqqE/SkfB family radical SAM enzyme